ncbi:hypothetical protein ACTQ3Z_06125 [Lawsonibacter sp. LCP25S3_F5]
MMKIYNDKGYGSQRFQRVHRNSLLLAFALWISGLCVDQTDAQQTAGPLHPVCAVLGAVVKAEPLKPAGHY